VTSGSCADSLTKIAENGSVIYWHVARLAAWPMLRVREAECKDDTGSCRAGQGSSDFR
jgi:hypothetical protein